MPLLRLLPCYSCKLGLLPGPKKAVPAIDTVPAKTANRCCTVMNGSLLFNARQAYETPPTHNNRSRGAGGVCYHCGLLETSASKGGRGQNREEEEKYATIGNLDCYRKNLGLSYGCFGWGRGKAVLIFLLLRIEMKHLLLTTVAAVLLVGTVVTAPIHDASREKEAL